MNLRQEKLLKDFLNDNPDMIDLIDLKGEEKACMDTLEDKIASIEILILDDDLIRENPDEFVSQVNTILS